MVQALDAHALLQNTRLSLRIALSKSTVHVQLAQAHFMRWDPPASGLVLGAAACFLVAFDFFIMPPVCLQHRPVSNECKKFIGIIGRISTSSMRPGIFVA